ncbi:hypothetical protein BB560_006821, partial [Smittium megazygosporum]
MEVKHLLLNPGGDCVILHWQDFLRENPELYTQSLEPLPAPTLPNLPAANSPKTQEESVQAEEQLDSEILDNESEDEEDYSSKLGAQNLPDAIANDPFFARLLRNAESYSSTGPKK